MERGDGVNWTAVYGALAHGGRREILRKLGESASTTAFGDVALHLLHAEEAVPGEPRLDRIETQLRHVHLPKLADAGLVVWDDDGGTLAPTALALRLPVGVVNGPAATDGCPTAVERADE